jgi:hypothetical protein
MKTVAVIDGKGGGLGSAIVKKISSMKDVTIIALGTNSHATSGMIKSGAHDGATGENAICQMAGRADIIIGPIAIITADSMMGEITPKMAQAIAGSPAHKILLPTQKCGISVVGVENSTMTQLIDMIPDMLLQELK